MHVWKHCDQDVREKGEREREGRTKRFKKRGGLGEWNVEDKNGKKGSDVLKKKKAHKPAICYFLSSH